MERRTASEELLDLAKQGNTDIFSEEFSKYLDSRDELSYLRNEFIIPRAKTNPEADTELIHPDDECIFLCGNSLGLQPKSLSKFVSKVITDIARKANLAKEDRATTECAEELLPQLANIVGAHQDEIAIMNALTVNLHMLMVSFYQPTPERFKILIEDKAFPSDHYVAESQIRYHGYDPEIALITIKPRQGEYTLRTEDILDLIEKEGNTIALIMFPGVQYFTGQLFDMARITKAGHEKGCMVGYDLAHAVGNVELFLHHWDVDFACWCSYKYLNSGPGAIGGAFIHRKFEHNTFSKFVGPRGYASSEGPQTELSSGIKGYEITPPSPVLVACLKYSLDIFSKTTIKDLRKKSFLLSGYMEYLIENKLSKCGEADEPLVKIITPRNFEERGAQLSLVFSVPIEKVFKEMSRRGIYCDVRKPNVIRITPMPSYTSFYEVYKFVKVLQNCFEDTSAEKN